MWRPESGRETKNLGWAVLLLSLALAACSGTPVEQVCQAVADCSQAGSADWVQQCSDEAHQLAQEATATGCARKFDSYYACANTHYDCVTNQATFVGCEQARADLDACLEVARAGTSCGALQQQLANCPGSSDAGLVVPPTCTTTRACEARCLLDHVAKVCTPNLAELDSSVACAKACPP